MSTQKMVVMDKYPFDLLPGEARKVSKDDLSYYQYVNDSRLRAQTGKNIQSVMWCLRDSPENLRIEEPFGGVGVFATALNNILKPSYHRIIEIDDQCVEQLRHCLRDGMNVQIIHGDSHDWMGVDPMDISVFDVPLFGISRYKNGWWREEIERTFKHEPERIVVTDGCRFMFHMHWKMYKEKYDDSVTRNPESYVYMMSKIFYEDFGYSATRCAYHSSCFYYMLEKTKPAEIEFKHYGSGTGEAGLRMASPLENFI